MFGRAISDILSMQPKIFHSESPRKPSPTRPIAANGVAQPTPNRRLKISAKFSERWKVSTGSQQTEDCGSLSTSKQYDLRQLKKDQQAQQLSPEKDGISRNDDLYSVAALTRGVCIRAQL